MISGLDMAVVPPGHHNDRGGLVALVVETARRFDGVPLKTPPPVVWLGRCYHGFAAVGLASMVLYEQYMPPPPECRAVAAACKAACDVLGTVLGEPLAEVFALDAGTTARAYNDPMMAWEGPDLSGCVEQMLRLALGIREICEHLAADTTVMSDQRKAFDCGAATANFVWTQYAVG
ncbi:MULTISPECIES: hypothetical protein [unclassified Nocardia]|uniref:hypothetical protein n=1 Tax=unclassified Nocardia TaxID=2637762 RepID=UPI00278C4A77|nr:MULTISPECIES: hypothetical protein [unclassified Nocardia]